SAEGGADPAIAGRQWPAGGRERRPGGAELEGIGGGERGELQPAGFLPSARGGGLRAGGALGERRGAGAVRGVPFLRPCLPGEARAAQAAGVDGEPPERAAGGGGAGTRPLPRGGDAGGLFRSRGAGGDPAPFPRAAGPAVRGERAFRGAVGGGADRQLRRAGGGGGAD